MIPPKQIGWSVEAILLHDISKQLDKLIRQFCECATTTSTTTINPL